MGNFHNNQHIAVVTIIPLLLFFRRTQIVVRLKGKKKGKFWLGTMVLIVGILFFAPLAWQATKDFLFPPQPVSIYLFPSYIIMVVVLIFIALGLVMMRSGTNAENLSSKR
jgi:hypothetical protein